MGAGLNKRMVLSAVNIIDGGPLTILSSFIESMQNEAFSDWQFVALVHPSVNLNFGRVKRLGISAPKKSWFIRLYYEYVVFKRVSKRLRPEVWLSLHDISPNVMVSRQFVYCHNPAPFYRLSWRDIWLDPKFFFFNKLYKLFYKLNINNNHAVIVQQRWLKDEFEKFTKVPVHVSHPEYVAARGVPNVLEKQNKAIFVFPAFPRVFKNHVVICKALNALTDAERSNVCVVFTVSGRENRYAAWLWNKYHKIDALDFRGRLSYEETQRLFTEADCVLFPSKLETWGLPLTEAKHFGKKVICADLPYAHETLGGYPYVQYLSADSVDQWAQAIRKYALNRKHNVEHELRSVIAKPDSLGTTQLLDFILKTSRKNLDV